MFSYSAIVIPRQSSVSAIKTRKAYADEFLDLLTFSVQARMRCIGKMGVSVSGGMDSTSVAVTLRHELDEFRGQLPDGRDEHLFTAL